MPFKGWPVEAIEFFEGLEADNSRSYWQENKTVYETKVLAPMTALLDELAPEFGPGRVFRPYRDVRFSRDKAPYKTNIAASNDRGYISLSSAGLGVGTGLYMPEAGQLERFRAAVADERSGPELEKLVATLAKAGIDIGTHNQLKTAPRGYPKDHPRIELLRYKGITAWRQWPVGSWLGTAAAKKRVIDVLHRSAPLNDWLDRNVGAGSGPQPG